MKEPRMIFGFSILGVLFVLSAMIAIGQVKMETSYGLDIVLGALSVLAGHFAAWAFGNKENGEKQ